MYKSKYFLTAVLLFVTYILAAQTQQPEYTITGIVYDEFNEPMPSATVYVKNTTQGTLSDMEGKFSIKVRRGSTLSISFVGYETY